jgi:hypothetical protein
VKSGRHLPMFWRNLHPSIFSIEDGGGVLLRNAGKPLPDFTASRPRKQ